MPNEHSRVGIAGTVYYQNPGQDPTGAPLRGSMQLESGEEAFTRSPPKPLEASWEPLDFGWLSACSLLCVRNLEPQGGPAIELGHPANESGYPGAGLGLWIPAGMTTVIYPRGITLALRCPDGEAHYSLFAAPE